MEIGGAPGECKRPTVVWSIQFIVTISFRSSLVHWNLIRLGKLTFKPPTWGPPPQTSSIPNSYTILFSFSDRPAWLEYKAHSATMLTSTREYN